MLVISGLILYLVMIIIDILFGPDKTEIMSRTVIKTLEMTEGIILTWPNVVQLIGIVLAGIGSIMIFIGTGERKSGIRTIDRFSLSMCLLGVSFFVINFVFIFFFDKGGSDPFDLGIKWGRIIMLMFYMGVFLLIWKEIPRPMSYITLIVLGGYFIFSIILRSWPLKDILSNSFLLTYWIIVTVLLIVSLSICYIIYIRRLTKKDEDKTLKHPDKIIRGFSSNI